MMTERKRDEGCARNAALQAAYWADVYEQCHRQVRAYFARHVRCSHDVDDLVQEVFASLIVRGGRLEEPMTCIRAVARHPLCAYWRSSGRRNLALERMQLACGDSARTAGAPCDRDANPIVQLGKREIHEAVLLMLDSLPRTSAEILRPKYIQGTNSRDAASRTGCSPETVKKRLTRAKQSLARPCSGGVGRRGAGGVSSLIDPTLC